MSEEYEVPAHHEQQIEHEADAGHALSQYVAIFTALLATLGAIVSYQGGHTQNEALYYKNNAVLNRTLAGDQWAYYQAKSIKQQLTEVIADESSDASRAKALRDKASRFAAEKEEIKAKADAYDKAAQDSNAQAEHALHPHERLSLAMTLIQIAISAASITALTRKRWLFSLAGLSAVAGILVWVSAYFGPL